MECGVCGQGLDIRMANGYLPTYQGNLPAQFLTRSSMGGSAHLGPGLSYLSHSGLRLR